MTKHDDFIGLSRAAFLTSRGPTLLDVRAAVRADMSIESVRKRDMLSALKRIEVHVDRAISEIPATAPAVREIFKNLKPVRMGVSDKSFRNIRSSAIAAVRRHGGAPKPITKRIPLSRAWKAMLEKIPTNHIRQGLHRLAAYGSYMGIDPEAVSQETLEGLHAALEAEEIVKNPRRLVKDTKAKWNWCMREVAGWPQVRLEGLFKTQPYTFPLTAFPESLQREVENWVRHVSCPDPLDVDAPVRPLRPDTVEARILGIRRFASALVHRGDLGIEEIASISVLLTPDRFKSACRFLIERVGGEPTESVHNLANAMCRIGRHWCKLDQETLRALSALCKRLKPEPKPHMSESKRNRLRQFDDPRNVRKFLSFPATQVAKARTLDNPLRAAKCVERALLVAILIQCCLRQRTLRMLELADFQRVTTRQGEKRLLIIPPRKVKGRRQLEFELTDETSAILDLYITTYRPMMPGSEGPYLIPGLDGRMRSKNSVRDAISRSLLEETGLVVNPHLIRDIMGKILVEHDPAAYGAVTTMLGHSSDVTTRRHYLGSETRAAGKYLDSILREILSREHGKEE